MLPGALTNVRYQIIYMKSVIIRRTDKETGARYFNGPFLLQTSLYGQQQYDCCFEQLKKTRFHISHYKSSINNVSAVFKVSLLSIDNMCRIQGES